VLDWQIVVAKDSALANSLASFLNQSVLQIAVKRFADTESFVDFSEFEKIQNKNICVVQQFCFSKYEGVNEQLFNFLFLSDFLKKAGAKKITAVLPYLAYSRQDKSFDKKFVGAIEFVGKFFKDVGIDDVVCVALHEPDIKSFFATKLYEISLADFWSKFLLNFKNESNKNSNEKICLVSPDKGRISRVKKVAELIGADFANIEKQRTLVDRSIALNLVGDVRGKSVAIVDDIIDTGTTAINACELLLKNGAKKVIGCFTHGIFSDNSIEKIEKSLFEKIFITDTIELKKEVLSNKKINVLSINNLLCDYCIKQVF
jgi:ribose-phosphate pyrophosphokinase